VKTHISLDSSRILRQESCKKNDHFLPTNPEKPVYLYVLFSRFLDTHARKTLLIDDMPYKSLFNDSCSAIFLESFEGSHNHGNYLLSIVLLYLVSLHSSKFSVQTYIRHNPFGNIRRINHNDFYYNMLFEDYTNSCEPTYYTKVKLKKKCNRFIVVLIIIVLN
jgi:hypothetical protein